MSEKSVTTLKVQREARKAQKQAAKVEKEAARKAKQEAARQARGPKVQPVIIPTGTKKEDLPEYQKYAHLAGVCIWSSEAARKYGLTTATITHWTKSGRVKKLGTDKNRVLLDEQDIAYFAEQHHKREGQGVWSTTRDGLPYTPKQPKRKPKTSPPPAEAALDVSQPAAAETLVNAAPAEIEQLELPEIA